MEIEIVKDAERLVIRMSGRFDARCQKRFFEVVDQSMEDVAPIIQIDLADVSYLDSSALGMLLAVRERVKNAGRTVSLVNAVGNVRQVIEIANFAKLFAME